MVKFKRGEWPCLVQNIVKQTQFIKRYLLLVSVASVFNSYHENHFVSMKFNFNLDILALKLETELGGPIQ